jgi:hypothetical protein
MLYWGEGSRSRNSVTFTNSDPEMIALFGRFLRERLGVAHQAILVSVNLFSDHAEHQDRIEQFWLSTAGAPASSLRRSTVNAYSRSSKRTRVGRLPYGTCRVSVHSTAVVQQIYGAIQELGGFERPAWLG